MEHQDSPSADTKLRQRVEFEENGVNQIPEAQRTSTPWTFFIIFMGGSVGLASIAWGWLPITLGLGVRDAITSIVVGTLVALGPIAPLILIGSRTATNNSTSSAAFFGIYGRLIGSTLALTLMVVTTAIAIWGSGGALVAASARVFHTSTGDGALAVSYGVLAVLSIVIAVYGYQLLKLTMRLVMVGGGVVALLMPVAFAGHLHLSYKGGQYATGSLGSTWVLSAVAVGVGGVLLMSTIVGDWTRYISPRHPTSRLLRIGLLAVAVGFIVPLAIGAIVTTAFADPYAPFPEAVVMAAPGWYAVVLVPMALFGGLGFSASTIYSSGLDLDAIIARLTPALIASLTGRASGKTVQAGDVRRDWRRAFTTAIIGIASLGLVLLGSLVWDASESLTAASLILLAVTAPWAAVIGVGHLRCRGNYDADALQRWMRGEPGGAYWYRRGWNPAAVIAWAAGSAFGVLTVHTTLYTGPLANIAANIAKGVDVSFVGSFLIAGVVYLVLESSPFFGSQAALRPPTVEEAKV